jgi:hypothetical protein
VPGTARGSRTSPYPRTPDLCSPVVGWRAWTVASAGPGARTILRSPLHDDDWLPRVPLAATCRAGGGHEAVHEGCACGIHAAREPAPAAAYLVGRDGPSVVHRVLGRVALWGCVAEAEHGWRGALAYPVELLVPTLRADRSRVDAAALARRLAPYGVPVRALPGRGGILRESLG